MTDAVFHPALNAWTYEAFEALDLEDATSPSLTPTQISGYVDSVLIRLTGSFSYDASGVTGGIITGFYFSEYGVPLVSYTGMSIDVMLLDLGGGLYPMMFGGDDTVTSYWNADTIFFTGAGDDRLRLGSGDDEVDGGKGTDTFVLDQPFVPGQVSALGGTLVIDSALGRDTLINVEIVAFSDVQIAFHLGSSYGDVLTGDSHGAVLRDHVFAGAGNDRVKAGRGDDALFGEDGDDTLFGNGGEDRIQGGTGNDSLNGGGQDDRVFGQRGDDLLIGGRGDDLLHGATGGDRLIGQKGDDVLTGGGGRDVFAFRKGHGDDRITDFEIGRDIIEIGKGASKMSDLSFAQTGGDVLLSFANVTILVENLRVADLDSAGNFLL